jgi:hypothetical protein
VRARLRGERYVGLLDRLVAAARAPGLGETVPRPAAEVVTALLGTALERTAAAVQPVAEGDGGPGRWSAVAARLDELDAAVALAGHLRPEAAAEVADRLAKPRRLLVVAQAAELDPVAAVAAVAGLSPEQAFEAGREHQRRWEASRQSRKAFLAAWAKAHRRLVGAKSLLTRVDP